MSATGPCLCCGRAVVNANPRQPLHLDCWTEHHSDPTGVWPPNHNCPLDPAEDEEGPAMSDGEDEAPATEVGA